MILAALLAVASSALALLARHWPSVHRYLDQPTYDPYVLQFSTLAGPSIINPTALQFGPDGRLYVATRFGLIHRFTVSRRDGAFAVAASEAISAIQETPNHTDQGQPLPGLRERLVTGMAVAGNADNPVLFASSSLDVWAQNPDSVFPHSIWIADHGEDAIYVLEPASTAPADRVVQFLHSKVIVARRYLADALIRARTAYSRWRWR